MAEMVAVLDQHERRYSEGLPAPLTVVNSIVIGVRVDGGPTSSRADQATEGRVHERSWQMPDDQAFATLAFFKAVYERGEIPSAMQWDCHTYLDYATGRSPLMARLACVGPRPLLLFSSPVSRQNLVAYEGYKMVKPGTSEGAHSVLVLPGQGEAVEPECLAVQCIRGPVVVSDVEQAQRLHGGAELYHVPKKNRVLSRA